MKKLTATAHHGGCQICGASFGGPWRACSELCWFLLNAEEELAHDAVERELDPTLDPGTPPTKPRRPRAAA